MNRPEIVLFWDLDGTLLTTGRAGIFAFEEALAETTGLTSDLQRLFTAGLTDAEIAALILEGANGDASPDRVDDVLRAYERRLPATLHRRQGHVMPNVREVLEDLHARDDVRSYLLTGNTPAGARAKLAHYGLAQFFPDGDGAFCLGPGARVEIASRALPLAEHADAYYVIGDTPADIACGDAIGARTIAVATGSHTAEELAAHEPWALLEQLPPPAEFRRLLGVRPGAA
jgi:phosphoglycolate phosphatase-like HAD superfamily hydrolase